MCTVRGLVGVEIRNRTRNGGAPVQESRGPERPVRSHMAAKAKSEPHLGVHGSALYPIAQHPLPVLSSTVSPTHSHNTIADDALAVMLGQALDDFDDAPDSGADMRDACVDEAHASSSYPSLPLSPFNLEPAGDDRSRQRGVRSTGRQGADQGIPRVAARRHDPRHGGSQCHEAQRQPVQAYHPSIHIVPTRTTQSDLHATPIFRPMRH